MMVLEASDSLPWDDFVRVPGGRTTLALLVSTLLALVSSPARANPIYHPRAAEPGVLPPSWDTLSCTNCHVSIGGGNECGSFPCFNPFGYQYWTHDRGWAAIAALDADDDGRSNEQELTLDGTLPGFPEAATHTGCDMTTCAIDGAQDCADGLRCESAHAFDRATTHYVFWFSCGAGLAGSLAPDAADWSAACVDIDECATSPCGSGACSDVPLASWAWPGYGCACGPGQGFDGSTCVTAGECTDGSAGCVAGALCADPSPVLGDAVCGCAPGEIGDARVGGTGCTDSDECASAPCDHGICHALALDAWSAPGFECACHAGYVWTGGACELVDECLALLSDCALAATCTDPSAAVGDFFCTCEAGLVGDGRYTGSGCVGPDASMPHDAAMPDAAIARDASTSDTGALADAASHDAGRLDALAPSFDAALHDARPANDAAPLPPRSASCACRAGLTRAPARAAWAWWLIITLAARRIASEREARRRPVSLRPRRVSRAPHASRSSREKRARTRWHRSCCPRRA